MRRKFIYLLLLGFFWINQECIAQDKDDVRDVSGETIKVYHLSDLINEAIKSNPLIKYSEDNYLSKKAIILQEGSLPDPMISIKSQSMGTPLPLITLGDSIMDMISIMAEQEFPYPGKLKLKAEIAELNSLSAKAEIDRIILLIINKIKQEYFELLLINEKLNILEKEKQFLEELFQVVEIKYKVGSGTLEDLFSIRAEISVIVIELTKFQTEKEVHIANINALLNRDPKSSLEILGSLKEFEFNVNYSELVDLLQKNNPILKSVNLIVESASRGIELSKKGYYPDFSVNVGYGYIKGFDDMWSVGMNLKIPLFYKTKQRKNIEEMINKKKAEENMFDSTKQELLFFLRESYLKAKNAEQLIDLYSNELLPAAHAALEASLANYSVGRTNFNTLIDNYVENLNYELGYYEQLSLLHKSIADIEMLTGSKFLPGNFN